MKLTKGTKPEALDIDPEIPHTIERTGDYIEIEIDDPGEIAKLRNKGFRNI